MSPLDEFRKSLTGPDLVRRIQEGLIGDGITIEGPFGPRPLLYADYVASGRALAQVEDFIRDRVLPYYANSHTQASYCGAFTTRLRESARAEIARLTGAGEDTSVVFTGSGSTAGINRIAGLLDIAGITARGGRAVLIVGPYEHHSNLLPWRESGAEVIEISEVSSGGPDMDELTAVLEAAQGADLLAGSFSAASNVTGIVTDVDAVTRLLKSYGALALWDYGCAAPYTRMDMCAGTDAAKDAIVFSPHKFPGGPGASGVMILRDVIARQFRPTLPGGGTVSFVSPWGHVYSSRLSDREEGGTPNVVGDIRVALALMVKEALGQDWLDKRQAELRARALARWSQNPRLEILGQPDATALPIFSFRVRDGAGGYVHHQLFTRLLSDLYGVQARGGCACAGPYAHRLLGLDQARSDTMQAAIARGEELEKPGWVRLNLSALLSDDKVDAIISAVDKLALDAPDYADQYRADPRTARFTPDSSVKETLAS
ncbi:aminotransferase class V-fold PLP-dependent enzyme [Primorskyibacter flagellatus]|uniref:Selenocysteine lyase/Cysteine desulfurase n=1 Tax=Primorskyibacter flagellatus TaxID=1387277 RepID=A0A1W1ZFJ4_9RHOB|nr:aminotransferase class V-fold PLP-dependent enzyme [Primorskyibacter flagellatus]SMC47116.1 Selenocysteine lyase/Cysteine desulfurase [Primorskyibacter flagellatus]